MKSQVDSGIRVENLEIREQPPSCCICLNVRIGSVLIGLLYLVVYSAWVVAETSKVMHHTEISDEKGDWQYYTDFRELADRHNVDRNLVGMVVACLVFVLVVLMIYGAALRRSSFIIPFFCWQVFDMCRSLLMAATMISYAPQVKYYMENFQAGNENIRDMSLPRFRMFLVTMWMIVLTVMYYMMTIIWDCFKHSKSSEDQRAHVDAAPSYLVYQGDMETMTLLPTYDDVVKSSPPPAYIQ